MRFPGEAPPAVWRDEKAASEFYDISLEMIEFISRTRRRGRGDDILPRCLPMRADARLMIYIADEDAFYKFLFADIAAPRAAAEYARRRLLGASQSQRSHFLYHEPRSSIMPPAPAVS